MFLILQVVSVFLISVAMALALAHVLELPGKLRLDKNAYWAVQSIYYPGFTIGGGFGEGGGITTFLILLLLTPARNEAFGWTLIAFIALLAMHLAYWVFTHPVNKFWAEGSEAGGLQRRILSLRFAEAILASRLGRERLDALSEKMGVLSRHPGGACSGQSHFACSSSGCLCAADVGW